MNTEKKKVEKVAVYARVSTEKQTESQTIQQQLVRLEAHVKKEGWEWKEERIYLDDGYSGATLVRPGLDRLRQAVQAGEIEQIILTAPDRLARNYVHQMVLLEEIESAGCLIEFLERPLSDDPNDKLLLQIRGAVSEYERTLIADRMRRGREMKYRAGIMLPFSVAPYGYQLDPEEPRNPAKIRIKEDEATQIREMYEWYSVGGRTLYGLAEHLQLIGARAPQGNAYWSKGTLRRVLSNPVYTGTVYFGQSQMTVTRQRKSALWQGGQRATRQRRTPKSQWQQIATIPAIVSQELFEQVQQKMAQNQKTARRNNKSHNYLLRALLSCGECQLAMVGRSMNEKYAYYSCAGKQPAHQNGRVERCPARSLRVEEIDALVWNDLTFLLTHPELASEALLRAHAGEWLPQQLQTRRQHLRKATHSLEQQIERLTEAYLTSIFSLPEYQRRRQQLDEQLLALAAQSKQLERQVMQHEQLDLMRTSLTEFCLQLQHGLASATFEQKRQLVELLIDRVIVTDNHVEIRYVLPTAPSSFLTRFCHLRIVYCSWWGHECE